MAELLLHIGFTLMRLAVSMAAAFTAAFPLAVLLGRKKTLSRFVDPLIELLYSVPKISLFPLIVVLAGLGDLSRIITAALVVFFQVLITVRDAASVIPSEYMISIESLGAGRWGKIRWVYIPALLPSIFTSLRIGTAAAFAVLFFTEASITAGYGMGRLVVEKWSELDYKGMSGAAVVTAGLGLLIFLLIDRIEMRFLKGSSSGRASSVSS
jgi:NitT/TauT family transport system permease protein